MPALHSPWQTYVPRIIRAHRHWLTDVGSLTQKLKQHSQTFTVVRQAQQRAPTPLAESNAIDMPSQRRTWQREVLLLCDGIPVVYAHTITPLESVSRDWPFFKRLGNQALGVALFANPLIRRAHFEYTRLSERDQLYQTTQAAIASYGLSLPKHIWARRCVFQHSRHKDSRMMVTEVMLPTLYNLHKKTL
jgi:chorismate--pyruvate lyase